MVWRLWPVLLIAGGLELLLGRRSAWGSVLAAILVLALFASFFIIIFYELRRKASGLIDIEAQEAGKLINNGALVIDLRSAEAYGRGHIVGAKNIQMDELESRLGQLDKSKAVVVVCDAGVTSNRAVDRLKKAGFESAWGLKGGMNGWIQAGLPVVTGKKTKTKNKNKSGKGKKRG